MRAASRTAERRDGGFSASGMFPWGDVTWHADLEGTEDRCRSYLEQLRWPEGAVCPRCGSGDTARLEARKKYYCRSCRYHFSVVSGTLLHGTHLPAWKWFLTITLMIDSKDGLPASRLVELLGVTYKTAWFVEHRIRAALCDDRDRSGAAVTPIRRSRGHGNTRVPAPPPVGRYHQLDAKYLPAYLAEMEWRSESRGNANAFRDTVLRLLDGDPLRYSELVAGRDRTANVARAADAPRRSAA